MMIETIIVAGIAGGLVSWWLWPRSLHSTYLREHSRLSTDMAARGLSADEQVEELLFRQTMVHIRHKASNAVLATPERYSEIIGEVAKAELELLSTTHKPLAKRVLAVVKKASLDEILYPDAMRAVRRHWKAEGRHRGRPEVTHHHVAAVRRIR
jgi:hypothetical protein